MPSTGTSQGEWGVADAAAASYAPCGPPPASCHPPLLLATTTSTSAAAASTAVTAAAGASLPLPAAPRPSPPGAPGGTGWNLCVSSGVRTAVTVGWWLWPVAVDGALWWRTTLVLLREGDGAGEGEEGPRGGAVMGAWSSLLSSSTLSGWPTSGGRQTFPLAGVGGGGVGRRAAAAGHCPHFVGRPGGPTMAPRWGGVAPFAAPPGSARPASPDCRTAEGAVVPEWRRRNRWQAAGGGSGGERLQRPQRRRGGAGGGSCGGRRGREAGGLGVGRRRRPAPDGGGGGDGECPCGGMGACAVVPVAWDGRRGAAVGHGVLPDVM